MTDYWLMPLVGFPFDTTLAASKLVFSGVAERFPRIRWILSHLGGRSRIWGRAAPTAGIVRFAKPRAYLETAERVSQDVVHDL